MLCSLSLVFTVQLLCVEYYISVAQDMDRASLCRRPLCAVRFHRASTTFPLRPSSSIRRRSSTQRGWQQPTGRRPEKSKPHTRGDPLSYRLVGDLTIMGNKLIIVQGRTYVLLRPCTQNVGRILSSSLLQNLQYLHWILYTANFHEARRSYK